MMGPAARAFPRWGWWGAGFALLMWALAWLPVAALAPVRRFTFAPLWAGYVVVVSALAYRRQGYCMLKDRPRDICRLTIGSALFWWYFELLNRLVCNWAYMGVSEMPGWQYFVFATAPFATVLPAVVVTYEWLATYPSLAGGLQRFIVLRGGPAARWSLMLVSSAALILLPLFPQILFPVLWLAPLGILSAGMDNSSRQFLFGGLQRGDWRKLWLLALAALICGFFWEMWNSLSLARWVYQVPYVQRFHLFEMPLLGYAGYLPFGLECGVAALLLGVKLPAAPFDPGYRAEKSLKPGSGVLEKKPGEVAGAANAPAHPRVRCFMFSRNKEST